MSKISRDSNIIKWYEYTMEDPNANDEMAEDTDTAIDDSEELNTDLSDELDDLENIEGVDPDLLADIMSRFRDAKQSSVDSLFMEAEEINNAASGVMSEEELIASICAPKQSNVDAFVQTARN